MNLYSGLLSYTLWAALRAFKFIPDEFVEQGFLSNLLALQYSENTPEKTGAFLRILRWFQSLANFSQT